MDHPLFCLLTQLLTKLYFISITIIIYIHSPLPSPSATRHITCPYRAEFFHCTELYQPPFLNPIIQFNTSRDTRNISLHNTTTTTKLSPNCLMKSPLNQMDLEEWELLPDEGFLEINDDGGNKIYSRKYPKGSTTSVFQMNYFIPKPTPQFVENTRVPNHLLPVPIDLGQTSLKQDDDDDDDEEEEEERAIKEVAKKIPVEIKIMPPATEKIKAFSSTGLVAADQDPVSQVFFFKKMKETEFVDMKVLDSPKSSSTSTSPNRGIMPQIEGTGGAFQFDQEKGDPCKEAKDDSELAIKNNKDMEIDEEEGGLNLNVWKWSLTGIGAICSFGVAAAATFCIIVFGSTHQKNKHSQQNQNFQFQIYSNDKRMKQMVHQASKLNEAISAAGTVRGVPVTRAQITFGGYYDASL